MKKVVIRKSAIESFSFLNAETIEKARKGEQIGGEYIYREEIAEKVTTDKNGNKRTTRYRYYYVDDMLKDSEKTILDKIMKFFYKKFPENRAKIEKSYEKENIKKDFGVDKKTYFQHVMEYLSNRAFWDKKFAKKEINEKYKKPVIEPEDNIIENEDDRPENEKPVIEKEPKPKAPKEEKKWKPNKTLMRKIWSLNTGKEVAKQEKTQELAKQKLQDELLQNQREALDIYFNSRKLQGFTKDEILQDLELPINANNTYYQNKDVVAEMFDKYYSDTPEQNKINIEEYDFSEIPSSTNPKKYLDFGAENLSIVSNSNAKQYGGLTKEQFDKNTKDYNTIKNKAGILGPEEVKKLINILKSAVENYQYEINTVDNEVAKNSKAVMLIEALQNIKQLKEWFDLSKVNPKFFNKEWKKYYEKNPNEFSNALSEAMMGNQNAKKDFVSQEETNGENNIDIEQSGISGGDKDLRTASFTDSNENVYGSTNSDNRDSLLLNVDESGDGPTNAESYDRLLATIGDGTGRLTAKQAREIREACHKLLASKTDEQMTEKDKALLAQFVGAGGTKEENASNTGVLTEFYTPRIVVNKCWELMDKWLPNKKTCIEPSSGIGRFAEGRKEKFTMFELEEDSARIAKILHPDATVVQGQFEKNWVRGGMFHEKKFEKYDCSVGNPPYMKFTGLYKGKYGEGKEFTRAEQYFLNRTLDSLKDNGVLVFVMPSSFLSGNSPAEKKAKELIASKGKLLEAWRLPCGTFDTTDVGTDIIVVRKEKGDVKDFISDNYFKNNPSHISGDVVKELRQYGYVDVVKPRNGETFETEIDKINLKDIEAEIKELPEAETIIEEAPKDPNARSKALIGNQNAKGKHNVNFVASTGKNMSPEEFAHKYGFDMDQKELDVWKFTDYNGNIDTSKLTKEQLEYIETSKNYVKNGDKVVNVVNYASGNIREKLDELEVEYKGDEITQEDYEFKKSLLTQAMPAQKEIGQFTMSPIADWTRKYVKKDGTSLIAGFYEWCFAGKVNFTDAELPIDSPVAPEEIPSIISFADIIDYIDRKSLKSNGFRAKDSTLDKDKLKFMRTEKRRETAEYLFNKYLKEGLAPEDQEELTKRWNDNYNSFKNPDYTKIPIFIDGMNENKGTKEFTLTKQQLKGVSFLTNKGAGLLAYDVGVGKTVTGICATVNQIQTGKSKRPLICVPNAVYQGWITEIKQFFPNIKLNELHNFNKNSLAKDWKPEEGSLSICTYEALEKITFKDETMDEIAQDVEYAMITGRGKEKSDRKIALEKEKIQEVAGRMVKSDDDFVNFEDLGFDHITVDEIHNFKNIFYAPRNVDIKIEEGEENNKANNEFTSLGGSKSDRGEKLFAITQYIQRHNNNRNVFGLSATPFQNSPVEIYNILSLFARQRMKDLGIYSLEEFVKQFARLRSEYAVTASGYKEKMVMKGFNNLTALQNLIAEYIDKVDGGEAHVIRPRKRVHLPKLEMTDLQKQIMEAESAYLVQQASLPQDERDLGSTFLSLNAMRMATLSPALVKDDRFEVYRELGFDIEKPDYKQLVESSPKLKFTCDSIIENYKKASKEGQVMYMPKGVTHFNEVVKYLVSKGIPKEAIGLMPGGGGLKGQLEREAITKDFNNVDGKIKVIIGSEAIKEGVSLNGNSTILYNTMLGWNPTEPQQVEGRIWRQGNKQGITHIVYPLLNDSIDPMLYQKYSEKKARIEAVFSYKGDSVNIDEIDAEELKHALIKDPAKRADLLTKQHKEKAESDRALYAQMIDILARQATVAFGDLERIPEYTQAQKSFEQTKKMYEIQSTALKNWSAKAKDGDSRAIAMVESINKYLGPAKVKLDEYKKAMKRVENNQISVRKTLEKRGIKNMADVEKKRGEYYTLMDSARKEAENAEKMREQFYRQAVADNIKNASAIPSYDEMLNTEVNSIRNDLHPMDEEYSAILKKENEEQFGKSLPLFLFYQGRFLIRK